MSDTQQETETVNSLSVPEFTLGLVGRVQAVYLFIRLMCHVCVSLSCSVQLLMQFLFLPKMLVSSYHFRIS